MPLPMEVGLGLGDTVLDGDPAPPPTERGTTAPHFSGHVYCGQTVAHLSNCWALVGTCQRRQELIRRWDSERELLRSAPRKLPEFAEI